MHTTELASQLARTSRFMQLTSVCYTTFSSVTKVNMEVRTARSVKGKCQPYQHYSTAASPVWAKNRQELCLRRGMVAATCFFYSREPNYWVNTRLQHVRSGRLTLENEERYGRYSLGKV